jgi:twitching motility two-component system response regulator PilG
MTQVPVASGRDAPQFNPVQLLEQLSASQANGYLKVSRNTVDWQIYLDRGQLIYATHSLDPFDRLERHLRRLSQAVPVLTAAVRQQARLNFDSESQPDSYLPPEYQAMGWLYDQQYLTVEEVEKLINSLNREVFESYLLLELGDCEFVNNTTEYPRYCQVKVMPFIEECQQQLKAWYALAPFISSPEQRPYFFSHTQTTKNLSPEQYGKLSKLLRGFSFRQLAVLTNQDEIKVAQSLYPLLKSKVVILRAPQSPFDQLPTIPAPPVESSGEPSGNLVASSPTQAQVNTGETIGTIGSESVSQKQYTIVCVDDSPTILNEINRFLQEHNLTVHAISNPTKALMEIARIKPDIVLLDVGMPTIDGYKLCRLLRNHPNFQKTPNVMVTGNSSLIDRAKARVAGATDYLTKPFTQAELVKMVFRYLT